MTALQTIPDLLRRAAERWGGRPALVGESGSWNWREALEEVWGLSRLLESRGVEPGERVGLIGDNGADWTLGLLAIVWRGAAAVLFDDSLEPAAFEARFRASGAVGLLHGRRRRRPGESAPAPLPPPPPGAFLLSLENLGGEPPRDAGSAPSIPAAAADSPSAPTRVEPAGPAASGEDLAAIFFTSGTSDSPRAVPLTHAAIIAQARALTAIEPPGSGELLSTIALVPLHHVLGLNTGLMLPLLHGAAIHFLPELTPRALAATLRSARPTHLCGVPAIFAALRQTIEGEVARGGGLERRAFRGALGISARVRAQGIARRVFRTVHRRFGGRLRTLITAGAPMGREQRRFWLGLGFEMINAYGLTETGGAVCATRPGDGADAGVGRPLEGFRLRLDEPRGGTGEVTVQGPSLMSGYLGDPRQTEAGTRWSGEWLLTGDLGYLDEEGRLHLCGRKREVIVRRGGETIDPEAVEEVLSGSEYVREIGVVGIGPEEDRRPAALVVPDRPALERDGRLEIHTSLRFALAVAARKLPSHERPATYRYVSGPLPRTPAGKLDRRGLRSLWEEEGPGSGVSTTGRGGEAARTAADLGGDGAARALSAALARILPRGAPDPEPSHDLGIDLGLDSLDRLRLRHLLEERLPVSLGDEAVLARTVRELLEHLRRALAEPPPAETRRHAALPAPGPSPAIASAALPITEAALALIRALLRPRVSGLEQLPPEGPLILCANHLSDLDGPIVAAALPARLRRRLHGLAKEQLFRFPLLRWGMQAVRMLPVDNRGNFLPGLRAASAALRRGESLLIFPEGIRSFDGRPGPWRAGAGLIALESGAPLVPVLIRGTQRLLPPGTRLPRWGGRHHLRVTFGPPLAPPATGRSSRPPEEETAAARRLVEEVRRRVYALDPGGTTAAPCPEPEAATDE